jgi:valyl-tRNA synthetase
VGVTAHPEDPRYRALFGKRAITPLFRVPVPIFPSALADPEKGTGILMVCTFGDATDLLWWREHGLVLRQLLGRNGRLAEVRFGEDPFPSADAESANRFYGELVGKNVNQARKRIVELLRETAGSATGTRAPLVREPESIVHAVKYYEKGDRPLELVPTRQWFVRLLDKKERLLAKGAEVRWHPEFMGIRYRDWTENLQLDWCISRQRYFGVPIPVWYPPVDPTTDVPPGRDASERGKPGGFAGESDIFDTWFTSSLTPQIGSHWELDPERHARLFPADVRPQSHEIIRTWAFYTIAKAMLHEDTVPWHHATISGWVLDPDRKKMAKSQGNVVVPMPLVETYTADGVRYWAASARLGTDTAADEKVFKIGKRLATKIFNAGKFVLSQTGDVHPISAPTRPPRARRWRRCGSGSRCSCVCSPRSCPSSPRRCGPGSSPKRRVWTASTAHPGPETMISSGSPHPRTRATCTWPRIAGASSTRPRPTPRRRRGARSSICACPETARHSSGWSPCSRTCWRQPAATGTSWWPARTSKTARSRSWMPC